MHFSVSFHVNMCFLFIFLVLFCTYVLIFSDRCITNVMMMILMMQKAQTSIDNAGKMTSFQWSIRDLGFGASS